MDVDIPGRSDYVCEWYFAVEFWESIFQLSKLNETINLQLQCPTSATAAEEEFNLRAVVVSLTLLEVKSGLIGPTEGHQKCHLLKCVCIDGS